MSAIRFSGAAALLACLCLFAEGKEENLLDTPSVRWGISKAGGAEGTFLRKDSTIQLNKTGEKGLLILVRQGQDFETVPGKAYLFSMTAERKSPGVSISMMMQMPGGKRSPFPVVNAWKEPGQTETLTYLFIARPDETKLRPHLVLRGTGEVSVASAVFRELPMNEYEKLTANRLLLPDVSWRLSKVQGAEGSLKRIDDGYLLEKTNDSGMLFFVANQDFSLVPGRPYLVSISAKRETESVSMFMMLQMPGGKRAPFPTVSSRKDSGTEESLEYLFTARPDETKVRPHLVVRGKGKIHISDVTVKELSEQEFRTLKEAKKVTGLDFSGNSLKSTWTPFAVISMIPGKTLDFQSMPRGGIICSDLAWDASKIKALEVGFRVSGEGGYLECGFTSLVNGTVHQSSLGRSVLPDGRWHTILFPVGRDAAWKGRITGVKFIWYGQTAQLGFASISAKDHVNAIYDFRPRGHYELSRTDGSDRAGLRLLDRNYRILETVEIPEGKKSIRFTAPDRAMAAQAFPDDAQLNLELLELPRLNLPPAYWRGAWIWCRNGIGPEADYVWLRRDFELKTKPSEAFFVGAGDDSYELFLNGEKIGGGNDWSAANRFDVTKNLRAGKNTMTVRVYNFQAWGGFIGELYAMDGGTPVYIVTDRNWLCHEGGAKEPASFERPAMVLGAPPVAPWNSRVSYSYVGPKGEIEILRKGENSFDARVLKTPAVDSPRLELKLVSADGSARTVSGDVIPSTGKWNAGETVHVSYRIPEQFSPAEVFSADDFLSVKGNSSLGTVKVSKKHEVPLSACRIEGAGSRPRIVVDGKNYTPVYYLLSGGFPAFPESRDWMVRNGVDAGCEIFRLPASFDEFWQGEDKFDFTLLDRRLDTVALSAPGSRIILALSTGMPLWWMKNNPDDATAYYGGVPPHRQKDRQALASKKYLRDAAKGIKALVGHIRQSPYAGAVIGCAVGEGWNGEWFWSYVDDLNRPAMAGYSKADLAAFRDQLRGRYRTDEALAKAWNRPGLTFDTAEMPEPSRQNQGRIGILLDPQKDMQLIDWFRFRNRAIGEAVAALCKAVKEETQGRWLAGAYYGYFLAFSNIYNLLQTVGHLDIERVARSPYVDFVTAPSFYTWRFPGESDAVMQAAESFTSHGKLVIVEEDIRTFGENSAYEMRAGMLCTPEQSVGALERAFALGMTRGLGMHWLEMYENWFREPLLIDVMREGKQAYEQLGPVRGTTPVEVTIVSDQESAMFTKVNTGDGLAVAGIGEMQRRFAEAGIPFRHVLLRDLLENGVVPPSKFYIADNLLVLNDSQRAALMKRLEKEKATVLWLYAAGIDTPEQGPSAELMSRFLGPKFELANVPAQPVLKLSSGLGTDHAQNFNRTAPWFYPVSGFDEVLGRTPEGKPALVSWKRNGANHIFSTLMNLPPVLIRELARRAGVHVYGESDDPMLIGNDIAAVHAKTGGEKKILLPPKTKMTAILGPVNGTFRSGEPFLMKAGRTCVFRVVPE